MILSPSALHRILLIIISLACLTTNSRAATTQKRYYAYHAVQDRYGVIAPWYNRQNGLCDFRVRIAAETLKRYPWVDTSKAISPAPHYVYNGAWSISDDGKITIPPVKREWMNGDQGQRAAYVLAGLIDYYRYSGDPAAIAHISILADVLIDHCQTGDDHPWPKFLISAPVNGKTYDKCDPHGFIQLDIVAQVGLEMIRAYELTGNERWLNVAKHWGDLFAEKRSRQPDLPPWNRYANPQDVYWYDGQTGGISLILLFLDELIRVGYTGKDNQLVQTRDAGREYLSALLERWTVHDTFARHYWDWDHSMQGELTTEATAKYLMDNKDYFENWRSDARNVISIFLNHTSANTKSNGDVYHGAWAYPESAGCCGRSLWYAPLQVGTVFAQYGVLADSEWGREMARRQFILANYDCHETGVVEDNIDGGQIVAGAWFKIAHPMALKHVLAVMGWLPEIFGANRENHIMRSSSVVNSVVYGKDKITYSTFDAPANTIDVLRLAFAPDSITADGKTLTRREDLQDTGYIVKNLKNGDCIISIRHDGSRSIVVQGKDPQEQLGGENLTYTGDWTRTKHNNNHWTHNSSSSGAAMTYSFVGNQVRLIGSVDPTGGLADVYVDDVKQLVGIDCWSPTPRYQQVLYYKNGLDNARHTLKIVVRGEKNLLSQGDNIYINAIQHSAATGNGGFGEGGGPTDVQRFIFGYTGRKDYVDSVGNAWKPGTEFVIRTRQGDTVVASWWTNRKRWHIADTKDPELYRYGIHGRQLNVYFTVAPGTYYVKLKFAETRNIEPKKRAITIHINDKKVVANMDIAATAGGLSKTTLAQRHGRSRPDWIGLNKAVDLVFNDILPHHGIIDIRFTGSNGGEAIIQAIEVGPGNGGKGATPVSLPSTGQEKKKQ
ncbi:MAG: hypothetical protein JSV03_15270 [Planctomycetota bacterium]|nr:MAG: hypothetical protein JSV03_15270 [Planctomycetota bacterium]